MSCPHPITEVRGDNLVCASCNEVMENIKNLRYADRQYGDNDPSDPEQNIDEEA